MMMDPMGQVDFRVLARDLQHDRDTTWVGRIVAEAERFQELRQQLRDEAREPSSSRTRLGACLFSDSEKVDFVQFETGNAAVDAQEEAYEAYNVHDVLEPVAAHELEAMSALRHPPPRLRLACAGILILLSRMDGEEQVPQEISFRAFCRLAHTADFVASLMNSINPATISRVKIAALESYVGHLDGSHDYLGR